MSWLGSERIELDVCDSTNDEAARLAARGATHGTIVIAHAQRKGRGRQGRSWFSPPGENLYLSCVLRPSLAPPLVPPLTLAAGLGVADTIHSLGARPTLKWPNDVMLGGRKLAGILTEMSTRGHRVEHVVTGIGVNLATRAFPPELAQVATSLVLAGVDVSAGAFIDALLARLETWLDRFFAGGVRAIAEAWMERAGLGAGGARPRVRVTTPQGIIEGSALGIDSLGRLQVAAANGQVHAVLTGDVAELSSEVSQAPEDLREAP